MAKHGNRAASSLCGTADCLEALGVNIHQSPEKCVELLRDVGMCFFFAQDYHTSMKYVGAIRKELGFRTVFNILGPLTNPGTPVRQLLGSMTTIWWSPWLRCSSIWGSSGAWWYTDRTSWTRSP
ncbi:anthranilate phosphoribosyltransferase [Lawsonibacter asaccharolyticus]|nr:anthranilate phosphoribosyltransferase [Lawsonibacter asaccharolyticus]